MQFKSRQSFIGGLSEGKNPKFLAINHETISKDLSGKKALAQKFTILRPLSAGFASAPYKAKNPGRNPDAKPLSQLSYSERGPVMTMYSYPKVGMYDKGPRSDLCWTLQAGNTIKLWLDEERLKGEESLLPSGSIPAFTVCEISVASKTEESVKSGWCIKITNVRPAEFSLHSMSRDLQFLSSSLGDARTREMIAKQEQPMLEKELETQSVAFWAPVRKEATLDDAEGCVKLVNWGEPFSIELPTEALMCATNCKRIDWACALLEVAIAIGAVSVLVISNDFWKGGPRAVPIIDAEVLLNTSRSQVFKDETSETFETPFKVEDNSVQLVTSLYPMSVAGGSPPACEDFVLAGLETELAQAHAVQFNLIKPTGEVVPAVWKGYYNAGPNRLAPLPGKRKHMQTMDE